MKVNRLEVVVGAQYGSEAKGHVTARLLDVRQHSRMTRTGPWVNVRVAGPNAGHTAYDADGQKWALRTVPVGATRSYPVALVVAPGSEIDLDVLESEVMSLHDAGLLNNKSLYIDPHATLIEDYHKAQEAGAGMIERLGSTAKGIGAARADRVLRTARRVSDSLDAVKRISDLPHTQIYSYNYSALDKVIIEGTQGYGLGVHGPHYPQCTSSDCRAIDFVAMAGINPWSTPVVVWAVARMFPIRVAGNSGPLKDETTWEELGLPEERTTVTQKVRRVGRWDGDLVRDAVRANGGADHVRVALTMVDQMWPSLAGAKSLTEMHNVLRSQELGFYEQGQIGAFLSKLEYLGAPVGMITTGPETGFML